MPYLADVWYVSYGSNLLVERFMCYLVGGTPQGSARCEVGCRDQRPPPEQRDVRLPFRLYFAGLSQTHWGHGGIAFIEPPTSPNDNVLARMYRITGEQFVDVVNQENSIVAPFRLDVDLAHVEQYGSATLPFPCSYNLIRCVGHADGYPMFTFTAATKGPIVPPAEAYRQTIMRGLRTMNLSDEEITAYLAHATGASATEKRSSSR